MRRRWLCWAVAALIPLLLTGCWDQSEIDERSNILAVGFDSCSDTPGCKLMVSRQVAIPGKIPLGGGKTVKAGEAVVVFSTGGPNEAESAAKAQSELNRTMSYGHMRVWVISEELARGGMERYMDYVRRLADTRRFTWMVIAEGRADAVIRAKPQLEPVPALYLSDMLDDAQRNGRLPRSTEIEFDILMSRVGVDPVVPLMRMAGPNRPQLAGMAVFRGDRMVGKLSPAETETFLDLRGGHLSTEQLQVDWPQGGWAVLRVFSRQTSRQVRFADGRPEVKIKIALECEVMNIRLGRNGARPDPSVTEQQASKQVKQRAEALVERLQQELHADILGIGSLLRAQTGGQSRTDQEWRRLFEQATFQIETEVRVRRSGLSMD